MVKNATVSARVEEDIKLEAENILQRLGIPVSVVINTLYRQIIARNGIPFSMTLPEESKPLEDMTRTELDTKLQHSYDQFLAREGRPIDHVFEDLERKHR